MQKRWTAEGKPRRGFPPYGRVLTLTCAYALIPSRNPTTPKFPSRGELTFFYFVEESLKIFASRYALLPFKGRCILNLLKNILLRSMKSQTEISYVCIHRDSKIKYVDTLFENRSPVYPFRDIDPILYPSILLSHHRVMITNIKKDIKNKGFNDLIDEATHILASLGLNKQIVEVAVSRIIDDVIDDEDKQESLFDALHMHDVVESALVRFETFGSKFSGDIAKAISKSFNSKTLSEGQIRANIGE